MRYLQLSLTTALLATLAACSSDSSRTDAGGGGGGGGGADAGVADAVAADASFPDAEPLPCQRDQDCDRGEVCNLKMEPHACVPGRQCTQDLDCANCFNLDTARQIECGHGFHISAHCDPAHGNVCVRNLGPCESCAEDKDCGRLPDLLGGAQNKCVTYGSGDKFCGRNSAGAGCPTGFIDDGNGQCVLPGGCPDRIRTCPEGRPGQQCAGTDQICPDQPCLANASSTKCANNDVFGAVGVCVSFCSTNRDCPADLPICNTVNGLCIAGCTKDSCAGNQVCHSNGRCGPACDSNENCEMRFGASSYCNRPAQRPPNLFKGYHDQNSCQEKGCERPEDCPSAGLVCNPNGNPYPECVAGCFENSDCLSGEQCKDPGAAGPRPNYNRAECRALARKTDPTKIGVCCNPGCTNRNLQCGFNQFCCGETGSAYEDPASCGTVTSTGGPMAQPGQCFDISPRPFSPFCVQCMSNMDCASNWTFGYNVDRNINGGQPFQEQEWCQQVAMGLGMCSVTCNPNLPEGGNVGCPRLWNCVPFTPGCFQMADCSGLPCVGADTSVMPPRPGRCQCGTNGTVDAACPPVYPNLDTVTNPRCVELGQNGEMYCTASYHCEPPPLTMDGNGRPNYPQACLQ